VRVSRKKKKGAGETVTVIEGPMVWRDANGVYWKRTVETDGTFSTPESLGKQRPSNVAVLGEK